MSNRTLQGFVVALTTLILLLQQGEAHERNARRPNILLILADDLGIGSLQTEQAMRLGLYQNSSTTPQMPNVELLSREGMVFERAYSDSPVCSASRYALLTGIKIGSKYSRVRGNSGLGEDHLITANGEQVFVSLLKELGYKTAMFGKWGFQDYPSSCGFDYYLGTLSHQDSQRYFPEKLTEDNEGSVRLTDIFTKNNKNIDRGEEEMSICNLNRRRTCDYGPSVLHEQALQWLDENASNETDAAPFFLYIPTIIPHDGGFSRTDPGTIYPIPSLSGPEGCETCTDYSARRKGERFEEFYPRLAAMGSSLSNYFDVQIGELVGKLKEKGVYDDTLIIITSDNGPADEIGRNDAEKKLVLDKPFDANGPLTGGKRQLYEGSLRVPNLFVWPRSIQPGSISRHVIQLSDIPPTLVQLAGWEGRLPPQFNGISFRETLVSGDTPAQEKHEYVYGEICFKDSGELRFHSECDITLLFGDELQYRAEWTARYPLLMKKSILDLEEGYIRRQGNLTTTMLSDNGQVNSEKSPMIREIFQDIGEQYNVVTEALQDQAISFVIGYRIVPKNNADDMTIPTIPPTSFPTSSPSMHPTTSPTMSPTQTPTRFPTASPSHAPTPEPSKAPSQSPTPFPSATPTTAPTMYPTTQHPSYAPTFITSSPTSAPPTFVPSQSPTTRVTKSAEHANDFSDDGGRSSAMALRPAYPVLTACITLSVTLYCTLL